ncbi:MAG TPA: peptidoglycan-binding domain-containing protein [Solirubrobacterales bacterium]|nr:peptidoglycan-binding domain-containing protein [Solirubrobacterales bacterium]
MKAKRTTAIGCRLVLFAIFSLMALTAYMPTAACAMPGGAGEAPAGSTPFDRQGMWVWYVDRSEGGSIPRIAARADRAGIGTLYVKAGDGGDYWSQFSSGLVESLHQAGLDVCAWQFVYGESPVAEAKVGAAAVQRGADCLVIDAEGQYEGRYAAADRYVRALRARIGTGFPLSLAGFPYVDYHPAFPYSVFFGPEGAGYNQPQMYWKAIGTSVRAVYEHTYLYNRLWSHPVYPIGQTYESPGPKQVLRFRRFASSYGGLAPSWWDWQETSARTWSALGATTSGPLTGYRPVTTQPLLKRGSRGDLVVWAQEHLVGAGQTQLPVTGIFGKQTAAAVRAFQLSRGLAADGAIGTTTWSALLGVEPARPRWAARRARISGGATNRVIPARRPASASLPAKADEIDPGPAP